LVALSLVIPTDTSGLIGGHDVDICDPFRRRLGPSSEVREQLLQALPVAAHGDIGFCLQEVGERPWPLRLLAKLSPKDLALSLSVLEFFAHLVELVDVAVLQVLVVFFLALEAGRELLLHRSLVPLSACEFAFPVLGHGDPFAPDGQVVCSQLRQVFLE